MADEITGLLDRAIENSQLLVHRRQHGIDRRAIGIRIQHFCLDISVEVGADEGAIHRRVDERDPLLDECRKPRIGREDRGTCEAAIQISGDRLRFEQLDVAAT